MVLVEVFGTGCVKCRRMAKNVESAVRDPKIDTDVRKIESLDEMIERGVMLTPALYLRRRRAQGGRPRPLRRGYRRDSSGRVE